MEDGKQPSNHDKLFVPSRLEEQIASLHVILGYRD